MSGRCLDGVFGCRGVHRRVSGEYLEGVLKGVWMALLNVI